MADRNAEGDEGRGGHEPLKVDGRGQKGCKVFRWTYIALRLERIGIGQGMRLA